MAKELAKQEHLEAKAAAKKAAEEAKLAKKNQKKELKVRGADATSDLCRRVFTFLRWPFVNVREFTNSMNYKSSFGNRCAVIHLALLAMMTCNLDRCKTEMVSQSESQKSDFTRWVILITMVFLIA
mgnify:CR=1 FL=1